MNRNSLFVIALVMCSAPVMAADPVRCRKAAFPSHRGIRMAGIADAATRVVFQSDEQEGCPDARNPKCETKTTIGPNDTVMVSEARNGFVCAWFQPATRGAAGAWGWIPESAVKPHPMSVSPLDDWVGKFEQGGEWVAFKKVGDQLVGEGKTPWLSKQRAATDWTKERQLPGAFTVQGPVLTYTDDSCMILIVRKGGALLTSAIGECAAITAGSSSIFERAER